MSPTAIPTKYAGTEFRSRLEARWAAFFDLVGWRWEYEPIDLPGWIPDFMLTGVANVLVEIKPADSIDGFDLDKITRALRGSEDWEEVLLLGRAPSLATGHNGPGVGWLLEVGRCVSVASYCRSDHPDYHIDFCSDVHDYTGRLTSWYDGNAGDLTPGQLNLLEYLWREAGNITRWNRPKVAHR